MAKHLSIIAAVALALVLGAGSANATLIGDTVTFHVGGFTEDVLVQEGVIEIPSVANVGNGSIDIEASSVDLLFLRSANFSSNASWNLSGLDWVGVTGEIVDIVVTTNITDPGFSVTFGPHALSFNLFSASVIEGQYAHVELITSHVGSPVIPEPATMTLLGLGVAGLALRRRKLA